MFFEVAITPKRKSPPKKPKLEPEEINILTLAPFTSTPKLFFENICIGQIITKRITIKNPTSLDVKIYLAKEPPQERGVTFSWKDIVIGPGKEEVLEIIWQPVDEGAWRDVVQITDKSRIKREIPIVFKSVRKGPSKKVSTKLKRIKSPELKKLRKKNTSPKMGLSTKAPALKTNLTNNQWISHANMPKINVIPPNRRETYSVADKENFMGTLHANKNNLCSPQNGQNQILRSNQKNIQCNAEDKIEEEVLRDEFEDSLELEVSPIPSSTTKQSLMHTPLISSCNSKRNNLTHTPLFFTPENTTKSAYFSCSTAEKSNEKCVSWLSERNLSSETYIKGNISGETYVKGNTSTETYTVDDVSNAKGQTSFHLDTNLQQSNNLKSALSPITISPRNGQTESIKKVKQWKLLGKISEESSSDDSPKKSTTSVRKRKSVFGLNLEPAKKKTPDGRRSPAKGVKRIGFPKKPLNLKSVMNKSKVSAVSESDYYLDNICNPYLLATTDGVDPFMIATLYYCPKWLDEQESRFKKWLNILLMPPEDLTCNLKQVDVAKIWQECKNNVVDKAPSREEVSQKFHKSKLLDSLRKDALKMSQGTDFLSTISKCAKMVENGKISIRTDKNIHLDLGLQKEILSLLFCYNPLWLRIGLETVFTKSINLRSNSDAIGLSMFIIQNLFNEPYLLRKYKIKTSPAYALEIKKHVLRKSLSLIYFLDQAKVNKLIPYDPCLFCKDAEIKESKEILVRFNSKLFSAMGDATKSLKTIKYVLVHKQTYIHEFEYGVENLGCDLRDGIRLTRIMEIILLQKDLTKYLRVPPISKLQKVHNVKVVFDSLHGANYHIISDIEPKDIVEGHREKTLSLLWQIIYKFQSPMYTRAVISVQVWWRSAKVQRKLNEMKRQRSLRDVSARIIQNWYRTQKRRQKIENVILPMLKKYLHERKLHLAACKIQKTYRMYFLRKKYLQIYNAALVIQRSFRKWQSYSKFRKQNRAALVIQNFFKSYQMRQKYLKLKMSVLLVEELYFAKKQMRRQREQFLSLKTAAKTIQTKYRANKLMLIEKEHFIKIKTATIKIQQRYRATILMRNARKDYLQTLNATITIQQYYRSYLVKMQFLRLKKAALIIQRKFRANKEMEKAKQNYLTLKCATKKIQAYFRAYLSMKLTKKSYHELRSNVVFIQQKFRANISMKTQQKAYRTLKQTTIKLQQRFRATKLMKLNRSNYQLLRSKTIYLQRLFRANKLCRIQKNDFKRLKDATKTIQTYYRANRLAQLQRKQYVEMQKAAIIIQRKVRATNEMKIRRAEFSILKHSTIKIQKWFRALKAMEMARNDFVALKIATLKMQRRFRANKLMKIEKQRYDEIRNNVIKMQRRFRATLLMRKQRSEFEGLREATIKIQQMFRARNEMKLRRSDFLLLKQKVIYVQSKFKAKKVRKSFLEIRKSVITIQKKFRATLLMRQERQYYKLLKKQVLALETHRKSILLMRKQQQEFKDLKNAAIRIQSTYKAILQRKKYKRTLNVIIKVQQRWKAILMQREVRKHYLQLKEAAVKIQIFYRACKLAKKQRNQFLELKHAVGIVEERYLARKLMIQQRKEYLNYLHYVIQVQRRFKAMILCKQQRHEYLLIKFAVRTIETRYSANILMKIQRKNYQNLLRATMFVQNKFRAKLLMRTVRENYVKTRHAAIYIKKYYLGWKQTQKEVKIKSAKIKSILLLQTYARGMLVRRTYNKLLAPEAREERKMARIKTKSAILIQKAFRGYLTRKNCSTEMKTIAKRYHRVRLNVKQENTMIARRANAIKILSQRNFSYMHLVTLGAALKDLEFISWHSSESCFFIGSICCPDLYTIVKSTNRSLHAADLCSAAAGILVNVCKYEKSAPFAWRPDEMDDVITTMGHYCTMDNELFPKLATLVWIYSHNHTFRRFLRQLPNLKSRMLKIRQLCERQQRMIAKTINKERSSFAQYTELPLPSLSPVWGLDLKKRPKIFSNSVQAARTLCNIFNL